MVEIADGGALGRAAAGYSHCNGLTGAWEPFPVTVCQKLSAEMTAKPKGGRMEVPGEPKFLLRWGSEAEAGDERMDRRDVNHGTT